MKRETVNRMLRKRLAESKRIITTSYQYEDFVNVLGGNNSREPQHRLNIQKDNEELEFLIYSLIKREAINQLLNETNKFL